MKTFCKLASDTTAEASFGDQNTSRYGIVLAAGHGKRMKEFISIHYGTDYPKQFVAFTGKRSMVQHTIRRAEKLISSENLLVVVDPKHRVVIENQLRNRPPGTLIYQPQNRETAPGILLPLSYIYNKDPDSTVAIFPSDQFILEENRFMEHLRVAERLIQKFADKIVLLGIQPDSPEMEYGWIQPGEKVLGFNAFQISHVERFHEKPDPVSALNFFKKGFLWNTLVMVTRCSTLWTLAKEALPHIHHRFENIAGSLGTPEEEKTILRQYQAMEPATISRGVLEKNPSRLLVINVWDVFWSDWGNGPRVLETLKKIGRIPDRIKEFPARKEEMALI